jgi:hypothetical protein
LQAGVGANWDFFKVFQKMPNTLSGRYWLSRAFILRILAALPITLVFLVTASAAFAWDGSWTHAKSGQDYLYDEKNSQGNAGTKERPQKFLIPPTPDYIEVDPEELHDYFDRKNRHYAPYALARITRGIRYNNVFIPKGYYLIKPGDLNDGSARVSLKTLQGYEAPPSSQPGAETAHTGTPEADSTPEESPSVTDGLAKAISARSKRESAGPSTSAGSPSTTGEEIAPRLQPNPPQVSDKERVHRSFVFKQLGKVIAVVPIHEMETYRPPKGEKAPKQAVAWLELQDQRPVLRFYYRQRIYTTYFQ